MGKSGDPKSHSLEQEHVVCIIIREMSMERCDLCTGAVTAAFSRYVQTSRVSRLASRPSGRIPMKLGRLNDHVDLSIIQNLTKVVRTVSDTWGSENHCSL
jgi:hypothetical protein